MATLELGYLLNLTQHDSRFRERMQYISRSGFLPRPCRCGMSRR
ncbi:diguanylate cyclase [Klebsiella pneumoniae]|uniref:Diguanylate cyclase n=1 Tax=Klebsiella pneumoniae TaxID=573 RepID=A0A378FZ20_KLEPN|nr:diguanylate cyclase [Klebsiella pneumoniae]